MGQWDRTKPRNAPMKTYLRTEEALCEFTFHIGKQEPRAKPVTSASDVKRGRKRSLSSVSREQLRGPGGFDF